MKPILFLARERVFRFSLLLLFLSLLVQNPADAALKTKKSGYQPINVRGSYGGGSVSKKVHIDNNRVYLYAEGANVYISDAGNGETKVWVDVNGDGKEYQLTGDWMEDLAFVETMVGDLSDLYIYGGAEDASVDHTYIHMSGGNVAGIFGGGWAGNADAVVNGNVYIDITGGTVGMVDGAGEQASPYYSADVKGSCKILLQNCNYSGRQYINNNHSEQIKGITTVLDFSTHTYDPAQVEWGTAGANDFVCQTGPDSWAILGYENIITIPADQTINPKKLYVYPHSKVNCEGYIRIDRCDNKDISVSPYIQSWTGHQIVYPHHPTGDIVDRNEISHMRRCSICGKNVALDHNFIVQESVSSDAVEGKHKKLCTDCGYVVTEKCNTRCVDNKDNKTHSVVCRDCNHVFSTANHRTVSDAIQYNSLYHDRFCADCSSRYQQEHDWIGGDHPTCDLCGSTDHTHQYENGVCKTCGFEHDPHTYDSETSAICNVCGYGCLHKEVVDGVEKSRLVFDQDKSNTSAGHFNYCLLCEQNEYSEPHTLAFSTLDCSMACTKGSCRFACHHEHTQSRVVTVPRIDYSVSQFAVYPSEQVEISCQDCGTILTCSITNKDGKLTYAPTLEDALQYVINLRINNATIQLQQNQKMAAKPLDLENQSITIDMNGCDLSFTDLAMSSTESALLIEFGDLSIINSKYGTTGKMSNITTSNFAPSLLPAIFSTLALDGVHVTRLMIGNTEISLGRVDADVVELQTKNRKDYTVTDTLTINQQITGWFGDSRVTIDLSSILPAGFVIGEKQSDNTWRTLYDHTVQSFDAAGPSNGTRKVAFIPCVEHHLTAATDRGEEGHDGTCLYCAASVKGASHDQSGSGSQIDASYHHRACSVCGHETGSELHTFNSSTGRCTNERCNADATIALHRQGTESVLYFGSLEAAWLRSNRVCMIDTIELLRDVTISEPLQLIEDQDEEGRALSSYVVIMGDGKTLTYTGTGSAVTANGAIAAEDHVFLYGGLKISSNWSTSAAVRPYFGYLYNEDKTEIVTCTSHQDTYVQEKDEEENMLPYHEATCQKCGLIRDENHIYHAKSSCVGCGAERIIVARSYDQHDELLGEYGDLKEAWNDAISQWVDDFRIVNIKVNQDVVVELPDGPLVLDRSYASIIITADDGNGTDYSVRSLDNALFDVQHGQLTIRSGNYQAFGASVSSGRADDAKVILEGGTFNASTNYRHYNTDGIQCYYNRNYGQWNTKGLRSVLAPGYYLLATEPNSAVNDLPLQKGDTVTVATPITVVSVSGTVFKCDHPCLTGWLPAKDVTCTEDGYIAHRYCAQCASYLYEESGKTILSDLEGITIPAYGHDYDEDGYCTNVFSDVEGNDSVCHHQAVTVLVSIPHKNGGYFWDMDNVAYETFPGAWEALFSQYDGGLAYNNSYYGSRFSDWYTPTFILQADIDLSEYEDDLSGIPYNTEVAIDLNGHSLNLCGNSLHDQLGYGSSALIIRDSQKSDKQLTVESIYNSSDKMTLTIEDAHVNVSNGISAETTTLKGKGGITMYSGSYLFGNLTMEDQSYLAGRGCGSFSLSKVNGLLDPAGSVSNAAHNITIYQIDGEGNGTAMEESGKTIVKGCNISVYTADGTPAVQNYTWKMSHASDVQHTSASMYEDLGVEHGRICDVCGFYVNEQHDYIGTQCRLCQHEAAAVVKIDGVSTAYTNVLDAMNATRGKKATLTLNSDCTLTLSDDFEYNDAATELVIDFADHVMTVAQTEMYGGNTIYFQRGKYTILDGIQGKGGISSNWTLYLSEAEEKALIFTILGGNFNTMRVSTYSESKKEDGTPLFIIEGGKFDYLDTDDNAAYYLGKNAYFYSSESDKLILNYSNYSISNCYVKKGTTELSQQSEVDVDAPVSFDADQQNEKIEQNLGNVAVLSFAAPDMDQCINFESELLWSQLQQAVFAAGYSVIVNANSVTRTYVEAALTALTVEESSGDGETVQTVTRMSFEVTPKITVQIGDTSVCISVPESVIKGDIAFRLPVDYGYDAQYLAIYHTDAAGNRTKIGNYQVETDETAHSKFVEIYARDFSLFDYQIVGEYILADGILFRNVKTNSSMSSVSYERSFAAANEWEPLYIPMSIAPAQGCDIAEIVTFGAMADTNGDGIIDARDEILLVVDKLEENDATEANIPYLIRSEFVQEEPLQFESVDNTLYPSDCYVGTCSSTRTKYTFRGIYATKDFAADETAFTLQEGAIGTPSTRLIPQRWWVEAVSKVGVYNTEIQQAQSSRIRIFAIGEDMDEETAIRLLNGETVEVVQNGQRYTLDGRLATRLEKGVQIMNNKKVIKK